MSEWVPEAQRIEKEAAEIARDAALEEVALWADVQSANSKGAAQHRVSAGFPDMAHGHFIEANIFEICALKARALKGRK